MGLPEGWRTLDAHVYGRHEITDGDTSVSIEDGEVSIEHEFTQYGCCTSSTETHCAWVPVEVMVEILRLNGYTVIPPASEG